METADRGLMLARQVWRYGVATGRVNRDITGDLKGALAPYRGTHFAAITDPERLGELLRAIKGYKGGPVVRTALRLAPLLFQRPGELRGASWAEIDLEAALWTIPAARMKTAPPCPPAHPGRADTGSPEALHGINRAGVPRRTPAQQAHI